MDCCFVVIVFDVDSPFVKDDGCGDTVVLLYTPAANTSTKDDMVMTLLLIVLGLRRGRFLLIKNRPVERLPVVAAAVIFAMVNAVKMPLLEHGNDDECFVCFKKSRIFAFEVGVRARSFSQSSHLR